VIAAGLLRARRRARVARARARGVLDLRRAAELPGDHDEHAIGESAFVHVLDERRDGHVVGIGPEAQRVEDVMVHRVIVPVVDATTERT